MIIPIIQAAAIALIALILTPGWLFYFDVTPKLVVLLLASGVALVAMVAMAAPIPVRRSKLAWLAILSLVSLTVSTALSPKPALSFYGTHWRQYGALAQAAIVIFAWALSGLGGADGSVADSVADSVRDRAPNGPRPSGNAGPLTKLLTLADSPGRLAAVHWVLRAVSGAGAVTAVYGIAQYLGWDPILPGAAYHIGEGIWTIVRPPSTLGYVSYFATWLLFVFFLSLAVPGRAGKICAVLALIAMALTGTRAALLGLAAGGVVWLYWRGLRLPRRAIVGAAVPLAIMLLAVGALYWSPLGQPLRSRARWFAEDPWGGARPLLWRDSLRMGLTRPWAGHGPETFTAAFPHYESAALARAYPDFAHESPHNIFLDALVGQGIAGLLLLAAWCALGFDAAWKIRGRHPELASCLAAALAAGIVSQQFTVFTVPTAVIFFTTIALAAGLADRPGECGDPGAGSEKIALAAGLADRPGEPVRRFPLGIPLGIPLLYFAARIAFADHALALAQRDLAAGNLTAAAAHYQASGQTGDLWYSRALLGVAGKAPEIGTRLEALHRASLAGERATRTAEDPFNAWYSLSAIYAGRNDAAGAERCLRAAIAAHPTWFKPHWMLAQVLRHQSRDEEAEREAALAADLNGGKHPEVGQTLHELRSRRQK